MIYRSLVSFESDDYAIGISAEAQKQSNYRNTIGSFRRLASGASLRKDVIEMEKRFATTVPSDNHDDSHIGIEVRSATYLLFLHYTQWS